MHDFAITEHYSMFLDFPFIFKPERIMQKENGRRGKPFIFDTVRPCFIRFLASTSNHMQFLSGRRGKPLIFDI
jgi:carotenoid cleavage dioxygenase-like enzyme